MSDLQDLIGVGGNDPRLAFRPQNQTRTTDFAGRNPYAIFVSDGFYLELPRRTAELYSRNAQNFGGRIGATTA
ncbi:hypothetical protein BN381_10259 [Candidatus Microthrix parvicella RN1]|uniref:Uncharacterized protein n=1 Tax=Candidatus Neomicrothrix parvicella RN1 TaxID=1229780 RepID=R4YW00_9ACTN|nr:hypothetical protein BN381_10259 [Candidatus Microthrix parvicella RN1]